MQWSYVWNGSVSVVQQQAGGVGSGGGGGGGADAFNPGCSEQLAELVDGVSLAADAGDGLAGEAAPSEDDPIEEDAG